MRYSDPKIRRLTTVPVFSGCRAPELRRLSRLVDETTRRAGTVLVREGDPGQEVMILAAGRASVIRGQTKIATLEAGALIGEIATLDRAPRTATVTADTDVTLLVMDRRAFDRLILEVPFVARRLLTQMAERLRTLSEDAPVQPVPVV